MSLWNKYDLVALMTLSVIRNEQTFQFWTEPTVTLQFCEKMRCSMNWISRAIFHFDKELIFAHHKIKMIFYLFLPDIKIIEKSNSKKAKNWIMEQELPVQCPPNPHFENSHCEENTNYQEMSEGHRSQN